MAFSLPKQEPPEGEYDSRVSRLREEMTARTLETVVLTDQVNIEYFLGFHTLTWAYKARPIFAVIGLNEVVLIAAQTEIRNVSYKPRSFGARYYQGFIEEACICVADVVGAQCKSKSAKIAIDYGQDFFGRGSLTLVGLITEIADGALVRAGEAIWAVRKIKTAYEIEQKRTAFSIVNRAFDKVVAKARIGISEREFHNQLQAEFYANGAETANPIAMTFGRGELVYNRPPSDAKLQLDDYLWTDFRATFGGYPADRNRIARAGEPLEHEANTYRKVRAVTIDLAKSIRPGETTGAVFSRYLEMWSAVNLPAPYKYLNRIGHGGGLDVTEPPSLSRDGEEIIEAGMVLHLEPKLELDGAVFQFEEVVHVTEGSVEFLSALSPVEIPIIVA